MLRVLTVFGTRPEAIKMAPVISELEKHAGLIENRNCLTGQHKDMVAPLLELFDIRVDYNLDLMRENQTLEHITTGVLHEVGRILREDPFDLILVQGDTTTSMAAALAAFYGGVRIGHVEAGLRTFDKHHPYPEEVNRKIIDSVSDLFFAHTEAAKRHLLAEGVPEGHIAVTGNTVIDALLDVSNRPYSFAGTPLETLPFDSKRIVLVTAHRRESFGDPFESMCRGLRDLALKYKERIVLVYPVHRNPNVRQVVNDTLSGIDNVLLIDQSPVARSGRGNPASYLKLFGEIRSLFAQSTDAKVQNFSARHFSFNSAGGGRCETCRGTGSISVDLQFLPDVVMTCPDCHGTRFRREVLEIKYRGLTIAEVLDLTVKDAFSFFRGQHRLQRRLKMLSDVGLEYITLGQPADTLSGGESQRLKLAAFLSRSGRSPTLFVIDEPTTGLHPADVVRLIDCLGQIAAAGHSVIVIEHDINFIRSADYLIDLGPEAGPAGGQVVAAGTPAEVARASASVTGRLLAGQAG